MKIFRNLAAAALVVSAGIAGWMIADPRLPIEVSSVRLLDTTIVPGGTLEWEVQFTQRDRCYIRSDGVIYDSKGVAHQVPTLEYPAGIGPLDEPQEITIQIPISIDVAYGTARYESATLYRCNPFHFIWPLRSPYNPIFFEVVQR